MLGPRGVRQNLREQTLKGDQTAGGNVVRVAPDGMESVEKPGSAKPVRKYGWEAQAGSEEPIPSLLHFLSKTLKRTVIPMRAGRRGKPRLAATRAGRLEGSDHRCQPLKG